MVAPREFVMKRILALLTKVYRIRNFILIFSYSLILSLLLILHESPTYAETYSYDSIGRLTSVAYDDGSSIAYHYDNAGNILQRLVTITMSLGDAISVLQILVQNDNAVPNYSKVDIDKNGKIELEEAIYILQEVSDQR